MTTLFDAHCHLQALPPGEVVAALARARAAGITRMACCATGEEDWEAVLALADAHAEVVPLLGLHPWKVAGARSGWEDRLEALLTRRRAGIGECGLDFAHRPVDRGAQIAALRLQLRIAGRLNRPVAVHCVRAWGALSLVLREEGLPRAGAMIHAFGGSAETARELQDRGILLSFRAATPVLPSVRDDRLLLESDGSEPVRLAMAFAATGHGRDLAGLSRRNADLFFGGILA